jgi:acyl dehydratase
MTAAVTLDDLKHSVGREIASSEWLLVTQENINAFAEATGDRQWIHLDHDRAKRELPFGGTVAHGFLTLSLLSRLLSQAIQISGVRMAVNYGLNRVRFPSPVLSGARIRAHFQVASLKEVENGVEVVFSATVEAEGTSKPVCVADWIIRYYA